MSKETDTATVVFFWNKINRKPVSLQNKRRVGGVIERTVGVIR
jgi:hypothetical protein